MIRPPGFRGAAFAGAAHGDARHDAGARSDLSSTLSIPADWAYVNQVHGATIAEAVAPGPVGDADALYTTVRGLPIAIATADCVPIVLEGAGFVSVVHAGWRGAVAGVVEATLSHLVGRGHVVERAAVGPAIGSCCYEVGPEVVELLEPHVRRTTWDTASVDLPAAVGERLEGCPLVWQDERCTYTAHDLHSYRRSGTPDRQVTVGWLP